MKINCEVILFRIVIYISENMPKIKSIGAPIMDKTALYFVLFRVFYFKNKNSRQFQFSISQIFWQRFIVSESLTCYRFSYAGNWELVKSIVGTKFGRSHVCLHSQAGNRLWKLMALLCSSSLCYESSVQKLIEVIKSNTAEFLR